MDIANILIALACAGIIFLVVRLIDRKFLGGHAIDVANPKMALYERPITQRDLRAGIALWASIAGAIVITGYVVLVTLILWKGGWAANTAEQRISAMAWALLGSLCIVGAVITGLGFAINKRNFKASAGAVTFQSEGGDDSPDPMPQPAVKTTVTTETSLPQP